MTRFNGWPKARCEEISRRFNISKICSNLAWKSWMPKFSSKCAQFLVPLFYVARVAVQNFNFRQNVSLYPWFEAINMSAYDISKCEQIRSVVSGNILCVKD